ncbi:MAG TPA: hypothetical protein ENH82_06120 [bacterium]|nr:hypothetical protein [bacterium]
MSHIDYCWNCKTYTFHNDQWCVKCGKSEHAETLSHVIPHNYLNADCCGVLHWDGDNGKILCNECEQEFMLKEV